MSTHDEVKNMFPDFLKKDESSNLHKVTYPLVSAYNDVRTALELIKGTYQIFKLLEDNGAIVDVGIVDIGMIGGGECFFNNVFTKPLMIQKKHIDLNNASYLFISALHNIAEVSVTSHGKEIHYQEFPEGRDGFTWKYYTKYNASNPPKFKLWIRTLDDIEYTKEYPERVHDESLDIIGELIRCPRREYTRVSPDLANKAVPSYAIYGGFEDDFDYLQRLYEYSNLLNEYPLPVLELWKRYGLIAKLSNRSHILARMNESYPVSDDSTYYVFSEVTNPNPLLRQSITIYAYAYDIHGYLIKDGTFDIYVSDDEEHYYFKDAAPYKTQVLNEDSYSYIVRLNINNIPPIKGEELIIDNYCSKPYYINVRTFEQCDWFVGPDGNDNNDGKTIPTAFKTINKAAIVAKDYDVIGLLEGDFEIRHPVLTNKTLNFISQHDSVLKGKDWFILTAPGYLYLQGLTLTDTKQVNYSTISGETFINKGITPMAIGGDYNPFPSFNYTISTDKNVVYQGELSYYSINSNNPNKVELWVDVTYDHGSGGVWHKNRVIKNIKMPFIGTAIGRNHFSLYVDEGRGKELVATTSFLVIPQEVAADLYVNTVTGDDNNDGTFLAPLKTLFKAYNLAKMDYIIGYQGTTNLLTAFIINRPITIMGVQSQGESIDSEDYLFSVEPNSSLRLSNIKLQGKYCKNSSFIVDKDSITSVKIYVPE